MNDRTEVVQSSPTQTGNISPSTFFVNNRDNQPSTNTSIPFPILPSMTFNNDPNDNLSNFVPCNSYRRRQQSTHVSSIVSDDIPFKLPHRRHKDYLTEAVNSMDGHAVGNVYFFGNDSYHRCLLKTPKLEQIHQRVLGDQPEELKAEKAKLQPINYFGASNDQQFTRHHHLIESNEIIKVTSGDFHSLFLTRERRVIVAGKNKVGFD